MMCLAMVSFPFPHAGHSDSYVVSAATEHLSFVRFPFPHAGHSDSYSCFFVCGQLPKICFHSLTRDIVIHTQMARKTKKSRPPGFHSLTRDIVIHTWQFSLPSLCKSQVSIPSRGT